MENIIETTSSAGVRAVIAAIPMVVGTAVAKPLLLGAMAGAGLLAAGTLLGFGVSRAARAMR